MVMEVDELGAEYTGDESGRAQRGLHGDEGARAWRGLHYDEGGQAYSLYSCGEVGRA